MSIKKKCVKVFFRILEFSMSVKTYDEICIIFSSLYYKHLTHTFLTKK